MKDLNSHKDAYTDYLKKEKFYSPKTVSAYTNDIEQFEDFINSRNIEWNHLHPKDISAWMMSLKKLSPRSTARKLSSLKTFYDYLLTNKIISKNHFSVFSAPKSTNIIPTTFSSEEMFKMIDDMPVETILDRRNKYILIFMYATGARAMEVCGIRVGDLSIPQNSVKIYGKGNKERLVPLIEPVKNMLIAWLDERGKLGGDMLFPSKNGLPLTPEMIAKIVKKSAGGKYFHPHAFRYSFATHLLDNQANIRYIQELLGHANLSVTQRYTKMSISSLKEKFNQFHPRAK